MAAGNTYTNVHDISKMLDELRDQLLYAKRITWARDNFILTAVPLNLSEKDMDPVQEWCHESKCGKRTAFKSFKFENEEQITMFLMRWSQ